MNVIRVSAPEIGRREVRFRWRVTPASALYRAEEFTMELPPNFSAGRVPTEVWLFVAMTCLHTHWALLRPCRVQLPFSLGEDLLEFWARLLDAEILTLEVYRGTRDFRRRIVLHGEGPELPPAGVLARGSGCAAAFSSGKDSLLQSGLLEELVGPPLLVATTSPLPGTEDHGSIRRREVLAKMSRRMALVEVRSDFREAWSNSFSRELGYSVAVNEIADTFLYFASLLAVASHEGIARVYLASETEVQENAEVEGRTVQHPHFMYSAATQRALSAVIERWGLRYGSLHYPLRSSQIQRLLWTRFPEIAPLQYSCWKATAQEAACCRCSQCLRTAFGILSAGRDPALVGIDLGQLLREMREWAPSCGIADSFRDCLPEEVVRRDLHSQALRLFGETGPDAVQSRLSASGGESSRRLAVEAYEAMRANLARFPMPDPPRYRPGFLRLVEDDSRARLSAICEENFPAEPVALHAAQVERSMELTRWITLPLEATVSV